MAMEKQWRTEELRLIEMEMGCKHEILGAYVIMFIGSLGVLRATYNLHVSVRTTRTANHSSSLRMGRVARCYLLMNRFDTGLRNGSRKKRFQIQR